MTDESDLLVPNEEYLKAGIHIGTKFKTKYMKDFIYKTRPDGLSVLNIEEIDKRLRIAVKFLAEQCLAKHHFDYAIRRCVVSRKLDGIAWTVAGWNLVGYLLGCAPPTFVDP